DAQPSLLSASGGAVAIAARDGVSAVAWERDGIGVATITTGDALPVTTFAFIPQQKFADRHPSGGACQLDFVVMFARALGLQDIDGISPPPDDLLAVRVTREGAVDAPRTI